MGRKRKETQDHGVGPQNPVDITTDLLFADTPSEIADVYKEHMVSPGDFYERTFSGTDFQKRRSEYVNCLKFGGLDIGGGNAEFGYRAPVPQENAAPLVIFRRRR